VEAGMRRRGELRAGPFITGCLVGQDSLRRSKVLLRLLQERYILPSRRVS
jgi:hypothetical protein